MRATQTPSCVGEIRVNSCIYDFLWLNPTHSVGSVPKFLMRKCPQNMSFSENKVPHSNCHLGRLPRHYVP
jgi:hypothetical protein